MEADIIIKFETVCDRVPDAENVINVLSAYVDMLKIAGSVVEPAGITSVGLAGVEDGSDIFKFILRKCETYGEYISAGSERYPTVSKAAIALAGTIVASTVTIGVSSVIEPDPRIADDQMEIFRENNRLLSDSVELQRKQMEFYGILQNEPAYESFEVIRPHDGAVIYKMPRSEFAERSGLWVTDEIPPTKQETRKILKTWSVVLIKPVLIQDSRRWGFARDGIEFSAKMSDKRFLEAIHKNSLPIGLSEGIRMKIEVKYKEVYEDGAWIAERGSHEVIKVLDPLPPPSPAPLFDGPSAH
ncbi:hypothetical protein LPB140_00595 [Sphingorhabdus lutea]|uniref:Uncharacterized protein n=1 Tax=Sphingorhabdus lutea TaxID=1913578 RepID=A0A1L3J8Z6_9SPHN|nr:hypothetical protein [Sphingorhabdus lutea]APG61588.1 hypothetical protein LPB140_00595 [Sphingorhabdus lutea]